MTAETSVEKLLRLATENVRTYQRFERGRQQVVRAHTETTQGQARGYIPPDDWRQGQQSWEARGEAAWAARNRERQAAWQAARQRGAAAEAAERPAGTPESKEAPAAPARRAINQGAPHEAPATPVRRVVSQGAPQRENRSLQDFVHDMEADRQAAGRRLASNPLFQRSDVAPHEAAIGQASEQAVAVAAVQSQMYTDSQVKAALQRMQQMEQRLEDMARQQAAAAKETAKTDVEQALKEQARARLALDILAILASLLVAAFTGGLGMVVAEVMAAGWSVELTRSLLAYHAVEKGKGRQVLAHPASSAAGAVRKVTGRKTSQ